MEIVEIARLIESLLFVATESLDVEQVAKILTVDTNAVEAGLAFLAENAALRGVRVHRHGQTLQLTTVPEAAPYIERLLNIDSTTKLSQAALETLAIVAYQQPITRARIEAIRGVNSDRALATLQARGLVNEVGRLETAGRPVLFGTTMEFLQHFGIAGLPELPPLPEGTLEIAVENVNASTGAPTPPLCD